MGGIFKQMFHGISPHPPVVAEHEMVDSSPIFNDSDSYGISPFSSYSTEMETSSHSSLSQQSDSDCSLYDLSSLVTELNIKRGLSKYYQGKSQSFVSISDVASIEDLAKKEHPRTRKIKANKGLGSCSKTISKKAASRVSCASLVSRCNNGGALGSRRGLHYMGGNTASVYLFLLSISRKS